VRALVLTISLAYEHVSEFGGGGVEVDASSIWRWVQTYAPELNLPCPAPSEPTTKATGSTRPI
jgi:hypothetical protein